MEKSGASTPSTLKTLLGLSAEAGHPQVREAFWAEVRARTETPKNVETENGLNEAVSTLQDLCAQYFQYNAEQLKVVSGMVGNTRNDHPDAAIIKTEGGALAKALEKQATAFAVCALNIEGAKALLDTQIRDALQAAQEEHKNLDWTYDLTRQMAMMCKRRDMLSAYMERIGRARPLVIQIEKAFAALEKTLYDIIGPTKAQALCQEFTGLVRKRSFREAKAFVKAAARRDTTALFRLKKKERRERWKVAIEAFEVIADFVNKLTPRLVGRENVLFLREWEVKLAYEDMQRQLETTKEFIAKFQVAEIRFRRSTLDTERQRLYEISSFTAYLDLLDQLRKGSLFPMETLKDVRRFESEILNKVRYVLSEEARAVSQIDAKIARLRLPPDPGSVDVGEIDLFEGTGAQAAGAA